MGAGQPYLYDARPQYSIIKDAFDPKAVTRASFQAPPPPRPKQEGPLLNFNRHPDSYLIVPYGQTDAKPMSPRTKSRVKYARWVQLFFRVLQLLGAVGMLICVICIRGVQDTEGLILRVPPGVDLLTTSYAIYHLMRPAKGRTAASSASYHFFAFFMDAGFIPFYVFAAMMANQNFTQAPGTDQRWRTFFDTDAATGKLLLATWLIAVVDASLHLISLFFDLYLVLIFRKIARLPPDMNPLEDNLTSRRTSKHKHKTSSISVPMNENRQSHFMGSTVSLSNTNRLSQGHDPLIPASDTRTVAFLHTRADFDTSFSPHNPTTARLSRTNLPDTMYSQPASTRVSRVDLHRRDNSNTPSQRDSFLHPYSAVGSRSDSRPASKRSSFVSSPSTEPDQYHDNIPSDNKANLQSDNWFVVNSDAEDDAYSKSQHGKKYQPLPRYSLEDEAVPRPLGMHPPTPPPPMPSQSPYEDEKENDSTIGRALTTTSTLSAATATTQYSQSSSRTSTPKGRYYGDLAAATRGVRKQNQSPQPPPRHPMHTRESSLTRLGYRIEGGSDRTGMSGREGNDRVVSRTGIDLDDVGVMYASGDLGLGKRHVSGKIAEEGRGGWNMRARKVSGVA